MADSHDLTANAVTSDLLATMTDAIHSVNYRQRRKELCRAACGPVRTDDAFEKRRAWAVLAITGQAELAPGFPGGALLFHVDLFHAVGWNSRNEPAYQVCPTEDVLCTKFRIPRLEMDIALVLTVPAHMVAEAAVSDSAGSALAGTLMDEIRTSLRQKLAGFLALQA